MVIAIPGEPQGKGRPRFWQGHAVTPETTRKYEQLVRSYYYGKKYDAAVSIEIWAFFRIPESARKKDKILMGSNAKRPTKKPDLDNIIKIVLDGLQGKAFDDDKQVVEIVAHKVYGEPHVIVDVKGVEDE